MIHAELQPPIQVATIEDHKKVIRDDALFQIKLSEIREKRIVCVQFLGGYQQGKTSTISMITGNKNLVIGDGISEETRGVWIDGPYSIKTLAQRFNIRDFDDMADDNAILFIDCEGSGGFDSGDSNFQNQAIMKELDIPFAAISSCVVFLANKNESIASIENLTTTLKFKDFTSQINPVFKDSIVLMPFTKDISEFDECDYTIPNEASYEYISASLEEHYKNKRGFLNCNFEVLPRPLPKFDITKSIFDQDENFIRGFGYVVKDLLNVLVKSLNSHIIHDSEAIYQLYTDTILGLEKLNFSDYMVEKRMNASRETFKRIAELQKEAVMAIIIVDINEFSENINQRPELANEQSREDFILQCMCKADKLFLEKFPEIFNKLYDPADEITKIHKEVSDLIDDMFADFALTRTPIVIKEILKLLQESIDEKYAAFCEAISTEEGYKQVISTLDSDIEQINQDFDLMAVRLIQTKGAFINKIEKLIIPDIRKMQNDIVYAIDHQVLVQDEKFTKKQILEKVEKSPTEPNTTIFYQREIRIHPNEVIEEGPWAENRREVGIFVEHSHEEVRTREEGNDVIVEKRKITHKADGTVETSQYQIINRCPKKTVYKERRVRVGGGGGGGGRCTIF